MMKSLVFVISFVLCANEAITQETYRAAVFDKAPVTEYRNSTVPTRKEALEMVRPNIELYAEQAAYAREQVRQCNSGMQFSLFPMINENKV